MSSRPFQPRTTTATLAVMRAPAGSATRCAVRPGERPRARPPTAQARRLLPLPGRAAPRRARTRRVRIRRRWRPRPPAAGVERAAWRSVSIHANATAVDAASARASPSRPAIACPAKARGRWIASTPRPTRGSRPPRPATKTSGKVTESATDATMYGAIATTSRPIWAPTSSPYALPRTRPAISAPATAKMPAVAATASSAGHADASTWRATRRGSRPIRVSGTAVTSPSDEALTPTTAAAIRYA